MRILGISCYYHDSAAALLIDGDIAAAAQEERFSRRKHDARFPVHAIGACLRQAGVGIADLDYVVFYDKPSLKFRRLIATYLAYAPGGLGSFLKAMPIWIKDKLHLRQRIRDQLREIAGDGPRRLPPILFSAHHQSHAASAFFASPFERAAVLCMDGVGEWATTSVWTGDGNRLKPLWEIDFPHSIGLLYSAFTYYTGFKVNSGEYKLMGLAPYGEPKYVDLIYDKLIDVKPDGTFRMDMDYFSYANGSTMTNARFDALFGGPRRRPEARITQREMDLARSVQVVTEEMVLRLARTVQRETGADHLCLAGGVALNCVANGRLLREGPFQDVWIQPAAGDAGGALGAALATWHQYLDRPRTVTGADRMRGAYLGPVHSDDEVAAYLRSVDAPYVGLDDADLFAELARILDDGHVVGWFQGPMEFGPRALGGRSIIGDPRNRTMQSVMNLKIKYRESFRPFAPSVLADKVADWFAIDRASPYMLLVAPVREDRRLPMDDQARSLFGIDKLKLARSQIPAVTHVDYTARIQTVHAQTNPRYHALIEAFAARTGCPVLVNTSFNVRGEPIVCTPADAYRCFMRTEMDYLAIGNLLLAKQDQPESNRPTLGADEIEPD